MKRFKKFANTSVNGRQMLQQISSAGPEVKDRFLSNLKADRGEKAAEIFLNQKFANAEQFIASAFIWKDSPEKSEYWQKVVLDCHGTVTWDEWWDTYAQK